MSQTEPPKYSIKDIQVLESYEAIRLRPAMYIGGVDVAGLTNVVFSPIENSCEQYLGQEASFTNVRLINNQTIQISDDGCGFPCHSIRDRTSIEILFSKLGNGKIRGLPILNALSESLHVETHRDGYRWSMKFARGKVTQPLKRHEATSTRGTTITFKPDPEIFNDVQFDSDRITKRLRELSFLIPGIRITFENEFTGTIKEFHHEQGISDFVRWLNEDEQPMSREVCTFSETIDDIQVQASFQHVDANYGSIASYVNRIHTKDGGTQVLGFFGGLRRAISEYGRKHGLVQGRGPSFNDCVHNVTTVVSLNLENPMFEGPTKSKLGNVEIIALVREVTHKHVLHFFENYPEVAEQIVQTAAFHQQQRLQNTH